MIRNVNLDDAKEIANIYNYYIKNTVITFEEEELSCGDMEQRIINISRKYPYIVYTENNEILAYAYINTWKERSAYKYSAESTIYLKDGAQGRGIGTKLYKELITQVKKTEVKALISGIAIPNPQSIALHEKLGFEKIGHFKSVGFKNKTWIDVGYWELLI